MPTVSNFWNEVDDNYGYVHRADRDMPEYNPEILFVFIHGLCGHAAHTWGNLPKWLLDRTGIDVDVFTYAFPAMPWQAADIRAAARHLKSAIEENYSRYTHILFCVHSTGGLIVKELLCQEASRLFETLDDASAELSPFEFVTLRTRRIFNMAVPHAGGQKIKTLAFGVICTLLSFGRQKLIWQLQYRNPWVLGLEQRYVDLIRQLDERGVSRPLSIDVTAANDGAVGHYLNVELLQKDGRTVALRTDAEIVEVRGSHTSVKLPQNSTDLIVSVMEKRLAFFRSREAIKVATNTVTRVVNLERMSGIKSLVGDRGRRASSICDPIDSGNHHSGQMLDPHRMDPGNQQEIYEALIDRVRHPRGEFQSLVVTGDAGVGKSVVLRAVARSFAQSYLQSGRSAGILPIFLPLQQVTGGADVTSGTGEITSAAGDQQEFGARDGDAEAAFVWQAIVRGWCKFVNGLFYAEGKELGLSDDEITRLPTITPEWVRSYLQNGSALVIFDGVDEFLTNNPAIGLDHFRRLLDIVSECSGRGASLTLIFGVRSSQPGLNLLADETLCVGRLSLEEAEKLFPGTGAWLERAPDIQLRNLLLTPLILWHLGPAFQNQRPASIESRSSIMDQALDAILSKSDLDRIRCPNGELTRPEQWKDALTAVAWLFFVKSRGEISLPELQMEANQLCQQWESGTAVRGQHPTTLSFKQNSNENRPKLTGFRLAATYSSCAALLCRTIFYPTGPELYRFQHREWEEFLVARYLATCIRARYVDDLQFVAFTQQMFRTAGEFLADFTITADLVMEVNQRGQEIGSDFVLGNFAAMLANSTVPLDGPAIHLLFSALEDNEGVSLHTSLSSFGYRCVRDASGDHSSRSLRDAMVPVLRAKLVPDCTNALNASLSWFYLEVMHRKFGTSAPEFPWPGPQALMADEAQALDLVCQRVPQGVGVGPRHRSLQTAFLRIQYSALLDADRPVSIVHYLYLLVVAWKYGGHIADVESELPRLLGMNSPVESALKRQNVSPHLHTLFEHCRKLYTDGRLR